MEVAQNGVDLATEGLDEVPVQISRSLLATRLALKEARTLVRVAANSGDDGSHDLIVSNRIPRNDLGLAIA